MFHVRSAPCPAPSLQSSPSLCALAHYIYRCPPPSRRPPTCSSARSVCPPFDSRQGASAFNQPLNLDTSSVTSMQQMLYQASVFNQPLSFDTSSVTTMHWMFSVRSPRALPPICSRALPSTLLVHRDRPPPPAPRPAARSAPYVLPSTLGSSRRPSTSRSASTRPASQPWATCSTCASRVPCPGTLSHAIVGPSPCLQCTGLRSAPESRPAHLAPALYMPSFRLGRTHPPCPMPTSCSFVARGRAPRPLPPLAMARAGGQEAAPEDRLHCARVTEAESMAASFDHSPRFACGGHFFNIIS